MTKINIVGFVNDNYKVNVLRPILFKLAIFTGMITLAMILIYSTEKWAGLVIYVKEVFEFILFIIYLTHRKKGRKHGDAE